MIAPVNQNVLKFFVDDFGPCNSELNTKMPNVKNFRNDEAIKPHVLVVDDDQEISETLRFALAQQGYEVSVAIDGNQGLAYVEAKNPDLIILDMMMPRRSGFLVLERLRQVSEIPAPVIMITGNEGTRHQEYAEMLGVNDYILKPFTIDRLLKSVDNLLVAG